MKTVKRMLNKICYFDLDGVFVPYPKCWLEFIELKTGKHFDSLEEVKKSLTYSDYVSLKKDYRNSDFKYNLKPREGSSNLTKYLHDEGYSIVIATTRPSNHKKLLIRTIRWLDKNNILFDDIIFHKDFEVVAKYPNFLFGVEDDLHVANMVARWGYRIFLMRNGRNIDYLHRNVILIDDFEDIVKTINNDKDRYVKNYNLNIDTFKKENYSEIIL